MASCNDNAKLTSALTLDNVSLAYQRKLALQNISFTLPKASLTAIIGPNGAGKSSMVKAICGRMPLQAGEIYINGQNTEQSSARNSLGVAPQKTALYDHLSAKENLLCFARQLGLSHLEAQKRTHEILTLIGMSEDQNCLAIQMSGGMRQRVNIGAAILHRPPLLILDEPIANLDPTGVLQINNLIRKLKENGYAILLISHDMPQVKALADNIIVLVNGKIWDQAPPRDLIEKHCAPELIFTVHTQNHQSMVEHGFTADPQNQHIWSKPLHAQDDVISTLSKLERNQTKIDQCTIKAPSLEDVLNHVPDRMDAPNTG